MTVKRKKAGWVGAACIAVSSSAREQFSALGQIGAAMTMCYTDFNQSTSRIFDVIHAKLLSNALKVDFVFINFALQVTIHQIITQ